MRSIPPKPSPPSVGSPSLKKAFQALNMFDGKVRGNRAVSSAGKKRESDKEAFLENTRKQREERATERKKLLAVVKLQSVIRRHHDRKAVVSKFIDEMDKKIADVNSVQRAFKSRGSQFNIPLDVLLPIFRAFLFTFDGAGVLMATKSDVDKLIRMTSVLRLFLNSLCVTVIGSFNPFLQAVCEMGTSDELRRTWGYQVFELCRLSVCLLRSYFLLRKSDVNDVFASNKGLLTTAVECSTQVLHTVLRWQRDIAPIVVPQSIKSSSAGSSGTVIVDSESILKSETVPKGESDLSGGEMFICSICRYIADSCTSAIRMSIITNRSSEDDEQSPRAVTILLASIQKAILPVNIPRARFKFCESRFVSELEIFLLSTLSALDRNFPVI